MVNKEIKAKMRAFRVKKILMLIGLAFVIAVLYQAYYSHTPWLPAELFVYTI